MARHLSNLPLCCHCCCFCFYLSPAGTGLKEAVSLLEGMLNDNTDFVRQGASIAMALVLLQQPESVVEPFRKKVRGLGGWVGAWLAARERWRCCGGEQPHRLIYNKDVFKAGVPPVGCSRAPFDPPLPGRRPRMQAQLPGGLRQ